ncbi:unnamed protein product [Alternaria alternata]
MATKRMNILVYSGNGSTTESVRHCLYTLRRLLSPSYAVIPVTGDTLIKEPWFSTCALLVFPGGADLGYCRTLNGEGNRRISRWLLRGERELAFFPGVCRGLAFEGFKYASEAGARAAEIKIEKEAFENVDEGVAETFKSYYNGGGVFVDAKKLESRGVQILASYTEDLHVESGEGQAAVVYRKVGEGHAVVTGPHPEFAPQNLSKIPSLPSYATIINDIAATDATRLAFMRLILGKLGLQVNEQEQAVPSLSRLHLTAHSLADVSDLVATWSEIITVMDGDEYIKGENDVFRIEKEGTAWSVKELKRAVSAMSEKLPTLASVTNSSEKSVGEQGQEKEDDSKKKRAKTPEEEIYDCIEYTANTSPDEIVDYAKIVKVIIPHEKALPSAQETPFHHDAFYANLHHYHTKLRNPDASFGKHLMYGEVVTSTNTLLEKNPSLLRNLPNGFTITATTQIAGRGRGNNVWIAPPGALMFSTVLHHSFALSQSAPVVFIQYLAALAILKWPNDIYAQLPGSSANPIVKIGGILVNSSYSGSTYDVVPGIGLNLSNALPTTTLNQLAKGMNPPLKDFTPEKLLASILAHFETLYSTFCQEGFNRDMESYYYENWLHTDQLVTLEDQQGVQSGCKARIKGITRDWGLLLAEEVREIDGRGTGKIIQIQSDGNSFDFFRGLVRRKV